MKSLTKKALSLAMAIAMAGSCMAFASTVTIGTVTEDGEIDKSIPYEGTSVSIPYTTTETDQVTVIVYEVESEEDATAPANDTIGYINQIDAPADGSDTITFTMRDDFVAEGAIANGIYKIIMGGTGVGEADVAYLVVKDDVVVYKKGDINNSGAADGVDLGLLLDHVLKTTLIAEGTPEFAAADINASGAADGVDLGLLLDHVLKVTLLD